MKLPLVSVFLPTYNQQAFIAEAIDSVLNQDYDNLEIVVGDDCSTDNTWQIVQEFQRRYPERINAFRNVDNLGVTGNCNEVLRRCRGEYIAFAAGDDLILPQKISKQVEAMARVGSTILCYHDIEVFDSTTNKTIRYWNHGPSSASPVTGLASCVAKAVVAEGTAFMAALSVMVRKDALPTSGFDGRIPTASDWMMWIDVLAGATPEATVVFLGEVLARYRRHGANISNHVAKCFSDVLVTLALVESKYPWLVEDVICCQARLRYSKGIRYICDGDFAAGRKLLIESARAKRPPWKWLGWFAASYLPVLRPKN